MLNRQRSVPWFQFVNQACSHLPTLPLISFVYVSRVVMKGTNDRDGRFKCDRSCNISHLHQAPLSSSIIWCFEWPMATTSLNATANSSMVEAWVHLLPSHSHPTGVEKSRYHIVYTVTSSSNNGKPPPPSIFPSLQHVSFGSSTLSATTLFQGNDDWHWLDLICQNSQFPPPVSTLKSRHSFNDHFYHFLVV